MKWIISNYLLNLISKVEFDRHPLRSCSDVTFRSNVLNRDYFRLYATIIRHGFRRKISTRGITTGNIDMSHRIKTNRIIDFQQATK